MKSLNLYSIAYHGAGVLVAAFIVGYVVRSAFVVEMTPPCSTRYPAGMLFTLQTSDGALMSPAELQAHVGMPERGVMENSKVVAVSKGPARTALQVHLSDVADIEQDGDRPTNGLYFRWRPPGMNAASAACLSYNIWLPEKFEFADGGVLPGIFGGAPGYSSDFATRLAWNELREVSIKVKPSGGKSVGVGQREKALTTGRWAAIEQEVVLNPPGKQSATVRLWIDGELRAEDTRVAMSTNRNSHISGVISDVGYRPSGKAVGTVQLSPFELSWR